MTSYVMLTERTLNTRSAVREQICLRAHRICLIMVVMGQGPSNVSMYMPTWEIRESPDYDEALLREVELSYRDGQPVDIGVGDLIFSDDPSGNTDHVAIIVGWGPPVSTPGTSFYPTLEAARADGITEEELESWVPYIVDHGGDHTQSYPRPWREGVSDRVWSDLEKRRNITIVDVNSR